MTRTQRLPANPRTGRRRNPRGEGSRLRDDIIDAATTIMERTGSEYALTLRAIAGEVGIAVASIFRHFDDTFAIIDAVTARQTAILHRSITAAADSSSDPAGRLLAIAAAYLAYGKDNPVTYRMLLGRRSLDAWQERSHLAPETDVLMHATLDIATGAITDCVNAGISTSTDPAYDTLILWFALDGLVNLTTAITSIDWPDHQQLLHDCVTRAAKLTTTPLPSSAGPGR
ncbi:MAG: TetR/AcrR family transcriptional regulator [Acidimicrobiales bacterium]